MDDPQATINQVVNSVKSEGIFDQFRKECLEEFENMETYYQLKQTVENHVASFLARHKFHDGLQKNSLRNELRNHISRSEVLLNGIQQLVDEVLSRKGHSFCLKIDKQVDRFLNPNSVEHDIAHECGGSENEHTENTNSIIDNNTLSQETASNQSYCTSQESRGSQGSQMEPKQSFVTGVTPIIQDEVIEHVISNKQKPESEENVFTEIEEVGMELEENIENEEDKVVTESKIIVLEDSIEKPDCIQSPKVEAGDVKGEKQTEFIEDCIITKASNENIDETAVNDQVIHREDQSNKDNRETEELSSNCEDEKIGNTDEMSDSTSDDEEENNTEDVDKIKSTKSKPEIHDNNKKQLEEMTAQDAPSSSYFSGLQTEPISDESTSNSFDSNFDQISEASDDKERGEGADCTLRKSKRVRNVPLKYRIDKTPKKDGYDSISSADTDADDKKRLKSKTRSKQTEKNVNKTQEEIRSSTRRGRPREKSDESRTPGKRKRSVNSSGRSRSVSKNSKKNRGSQGRPRDKRENNIRNSDSRDESLFKRSRRPTKQRERYSPS